MQYEDEYKFYLDGYDVGISSSTENESDVVEDPATFYPSACHRYANLLGYHNGKTRREPVSPAQFVALMDAGKPL